MIEPTTCGLDNGLPVEQFKKQNEEELFIKTTDHFKLVAGLKGRIAALMQRMNELSGASLIAFYGKAGVGKSTAANMLVDYHGFSRIAFADPIKAMLKTMLNYAGSDIDINDRSLKEKPCEALLGKSPRYALQTLGTEFGRECIGQDIWVSIAEREIKTALEDGESVVIEDLRFPNEAEMVTRLGGKIVWIARQDLVCSDNPTHKSETQKIPCDHFILNCGTVADLKLKVSECIK